MRRSSRVHLLSPDRGISFFTCAFRPPLSRGYQFVRGRKDHRRHPMPWTSIVMLVGDAGLVLEAVLFVTTCGRHGMV